MQKFILLIYFLTVLNITVSAQNFWEKINSPTSTLLNSVAFIDSLNGWVSGDSGLIIHTSDGGKDWETQYSNDSVNIINIFFLNEQYGWASAFSNYYEPYGTYILKTTNGGKTWNSEYFEVREAIVNSLCFLDSLNGFAVGYPRVFHKSIDGGLSWNPVTLDSSQFSELPPYKIKFYSPQYGYACGGVRDVRGVVWRTMDAGLSWATVVDTLTFEPLYDIHIFDSLHIIAMGGDPEFGTSQIKSIDGGNTWEYKSLGIFYYPFSIGFRTNIEGWVPMGEQTFFLYTSDSGKSWTIVNTPDSTRVARICFPDSAHGFGIGPYGTIVKYVYQEPANITEIDHIRSNFYLQQNYPNPFNPSTTIKYSVAEDGFVKLAIYNMLGEEVARLVNTQQKAGRYEVNFNAASLSSGVYVYRIEAANYTASKKLMLMK